MSDALKAIHKAVADHLTQRIASGEASAAELAVAVKFLKDNGVTADPETNPELQKLRTLTALPFNGDDDEHHTAH